MESVSLMLMVVGAVIIGAVLLLRFGLRLRAAGETPVTPRSPRESRTEELEFDPFFAIDTKAPEVSDSALAKLGKIVAEQGEPHVALSPSSSQSASFGDEPQQAPRKSFGKRQPPRVAEDPHRVVVLNVMAGENQVFLGNAVRSALENIGFEYGDWQIFHFYSPMRSDAPPLFSLANTVKPGSFDLERMDTLTTAGLTLFMVPPGEEDDIAAFDTMLGTARQLAAELGGEVRDARRSVLTRQAIGHIREQLYEWRCKAQMAQH